MSAIRLKGIYRTVASESNRTHRVKSGESLGGIARQYRVSLAYLKKLNGLSSNRVFAGQNLRVTAKSYHPKAEKSGKFVRYKVRRGDNLTAIARRFGLTVEDLKRANALKRTQVQVGQVLRVSRQM